MIRNHSRKIVNRKNEELVTDPHELLLSLVDMGSLDTDEALLACVSEMSDAECKRVLSSLSLPSCCDDADDDAEDDEMSVEVDDDDADTDMEVEFPSDDESDDDDELEEAEFDEDDDKSDDEEAELEARIRNLEKCLRSESMNRNRNRRFPRRRTNC